MRIRVNTRRRPIKIKQKSRKKQSISKTGGKVIGSGGFGCVLIPELKCDEKDCWRWQLGFPVWISAAREH